MAAKRREAMKKYYVLIFIIVFGFARAGYADTIKMGYFILNPHTYATDKAADGAAVHFFNEVAKLMGHTVQWEGPLPFPRLVRYLQDGTVDGAQMVTKNKKRMEYLYFPDHSHFPSQPVFLLKKDRKINKIVSVDNVAGLRVGFLRDANLSKFIKENINSFKMDYIRGPDWVAQNIKRVLFNRLDAAYDLNDVTLKYEAGKMGVLDQVKILPLPEKPIHAYTVFSKKAAHTRKYLDQYNQLFDQLPFSYNDFIRKELEKLAKTRPLESRAEKQIRE